MRDRFRFRAWDMEENRYFNDIQDCRWDGPDGELLQSFEDCLWEPDFIIEQCTGYHDCKGKLIYTNDILKLEGVPNLYQCVFSLTCVGFNFKPLNTKYKWSNFFGCASDFLDHCTVVGNIHENSELLEVNNER